MSLYSVFAPSAVTVPPEREADLQIGIMKGYLWHHENGKWKLLPPDGTRYNSDPSDPLENLPYYTKAPGTAWARIVNYVNATGLSELPEVVICQLWLMELTIAGLQGTENV